jgi:hypothetical protein
MRLRGLFRARDSGSERGSMPVLLSSASASRDCARLLVAEAETAGASESWLSPGGTDVMRDVPRRLRLVDVDLLQKCTSNLPVNGRSTTNNNSIAQADDLLKRVVRHGGVLIRVRVKDSESRQHPMIQPTGRIVHAVLTQRGIPAGDSRFAASRGQSAGPRFPFPAESGNGESLFPGPGRMKRGFPPPFKFPGQIGNRGNGNLNRGTRFPSPGLP